MKVNLKMQKNPIDLNVSALGHCLKQTKNFKSRFIKDT